MRSKSVLIPIDVESCPLEIFPFVNRYALENGASVILLHVSNLNVIVPENRLYEEEAREVEAGLRRLQQKFVSINLDSCVCVRRGNAAAEIVAQATNSAVDLIVMTRCSRPRRRRWWSGRVVDRVVQMAPCPVNVLRVHTHFNFRSAWRRAEAVIEAVAAARISCLPEPGYAPLLV